MPAYLVGSLTLGSFIPPLATATSASISKAQADLALAVSAQASLDAQLADPAAILAGAVSFAASGQALAGLQLLTPASVSASLNASLSANLSAQAGLNSALSALNALAALLGTGVWVYGIAGGTVGAMGSDLQAVTSSGFPGGVPSAPAYALVVATDSAAGWAAIQQVLRAT